MGCSPQLVIRVRSFPETNLDHGKWGEELEEQAFRAVDLLSEDSRREMRMQMWINLLVRNFLSIASLTAGRRRGHIPIVGRSLARYLGY